MKISKLFQWVLAAALICSTSVFTSCTDDTSDNPAPETAKKRTEFIKHTRDNLENLAKNLNLESWNIANTINSEFNKYVLLNSDFENVITSTFVATALATAKPVEEGSELAQMGFKKYGIVDFTSYKFRFTINDDGTSFDAEEADNFEMIVHGYDHIAQKPVPLGIKLTLKASGSSFMHLMDFFSTKDFAIIGKLPTQFDYTISSKLSGEWEDMFWGTFTNDVKKNGTSEFVNRLTDAISISGVVHSYMKADANNGKKGDATTATFEMSQDPETRTASLQCGLIQNGKDMIQLKGEMKNQNTKVTDVLQFTSSPSLLEALVAIMSGISLEEGTVTLLDDLSATLSISDCASAFGLVFAMSNARRNYADKQTIDGYVQQLNGLVSASMSCQQLNLNIPMRIETAKVGIDYWAVPALNFKDENGYVPLTDMLDKESIEYALNIADHAAVPMYNSVIIVNQLIRYFRTLIGDIKAKQQQAK